MKKKYQKHKNIKILLEGFKKLHKNIQEVLENTYKNAKQDLQKKIDPVDLTPEEREKFIRITHYLRRVK